MKKGVPFKRTENLIEKSDMQQQQSQRGKIDELWQDKKSVIDAELHKIVRMKKGVPFKRIEKLIEKSDMQQQQSQRIS